VHAEAQRLFLEGASFDEICERLERGGTHVNRKTLMAWAKAENWDTAKKEALDLAQEKNREKAADRWARVLKETEGLRDDVLRKLKMVGPPKTMEGGVSAVVQLTRLIRECAPVDVGQGDAGAIIDRVLDVLLKHPKVGVVIEKYREELLAELGKALKEGSKVEGLKGSKA